MNPFTQAQTVEEMAMRHILPWLASMSERVEPVEASEFLQRHWGDIIQVCKDKTVRSIELKAEAKDKFGNFFFELFSNKKEPFYTLGWIFTCKSQWLFYFFVEDLRLYVINMAKLRAWLFGEGAEPGNWRKYPERLQGKYDQLNQTTGLCVPIADLLRFDWVAAYDYTDALSFQRVDKQTLLRKGQMQLVKEAA